MVDDDAEIRLAVHELDGDGELALEKQQIVAQIEIRQQREAAMEIVAQEIVVRLALEDVADGFEFRMRGEAAERFGDICIDERHPADDARDDIGLIC